MEEEILALLEDVLAEQGRVINTSSQTLALYVAERTAHLSTIVGQPGFQQAVRAERDNVRMYAAIRAGEGAIGADNHLIGVLQGTLALGAHALLAGVEAQAQKEASSQVEDGGTPLPPTAT